MTEDFEDKKNIITRTPQTQTKPLAKFARPPFAKEVFTEENEAKFNSLPGSLRFLVSKIIEHGRLDYAAKAAGLTDSVNSLVDISRLDAKTISEALDESGIDSTFIATEIKQCIKAEVVKTDKHGNFIKLIDIDQKRKALEFVLKARVLDAQYKALTKPKTGDLTDKQAEELFPDV